MPIKSLEHFLFDNKSVPYCPLDVLRNASIGIDVEHYVSRLVPSRRDPNYEAIAGFPVTLLASIESDLEHFKELNVTPVFVFSGLRSSLQYDYLQQPEVLPFERHLKRVWDDKSNAGNIYHGSDGSMNFRPDPPFRDSSTPVDTRPIMSELMKFLASKDIDYLVSPYSAWIQIQYLLKEGTINCAYGSTDGLLLDGVDKFIFNFEFDNRQFKYLDRHVVLNKLNLTFKQFKEISMCVSNIFQPFVLNIFPHIQSQPTFPSLHEYVLSGGSIYNTLLQLQNSSNPSERQLMEHYQKGCATIEFMPVMKLNGRVEPLYYESTASFLASATPAPTSHLNQPQQQQQQQQQPQQQSGKKELKKIPNDLHAFIGERLPDELYFYQSIGLTTFELSETLLHGVDIERSPLDMSVTPLYEQLIDNSLEVKSKTLNILSNSLNRYFQFKKLKLKTVYKTPKEFDLSHRFQPPVYLSLKSLIIKHNTARSFDLNTLLSSLANDYLNDNAQISEEESKISSNYELIATALVRSFVLYDLVQPVDKNSFKLSPWGEALQYITTTGKNQQLLTLILIFFKTLPDLKLERLTIPNDLKTTSKKYKNAAILISKFSALLQSSSSKNQRSYTSQHHNTPSKLSRSSLQFRSVFNKLNSDFNGAITSNLIALLFMNHSDLFKFQRSNNDWKKLAGELPFGSDVVGNVLGGIIVSSFMESFLVESDIKRAKNSVNETFKNYFNFGYPAVELKDAGVFGNVVIRSLLLFKEIVGLVELLFEKSLIKDKELVDTFKLGDELVDLILNDS